MPTRPCLVQKPYNTGSGAFLSWFDSASNEDGFIIQRSYANYQDGPSKGFLSTWQTIATIAIPNTNAAWDSSPGTPAGFVPCYRIRTYNIEGGVTYYSAYSTVVCMGS